MRQRVGPYFPPIPHAHHPPFPTTTKTAIPHHHQLYPTTQPDAPLRPPPLQLYCWGWLLCFCSLNNRNDNASKIPCDGCSGDVPCNSLLMLAAATSMRLFPFKSSFLIIHPPYPLHPLGIPPSVFYGERCLQIPCNGCGGGCNVPRKVNVFGSGGGVARAMRCSPSYSSSSLPLPHLPHPLGLPALNDCYLFTIPCDRRDGNAPCNFVGMMLAMFLQGLLECAALRFPSLLLSNPPP